jgi:CRP-like cAMP-binding protein
MARRAFIAEQIARVPMFSACTRRELQVLSRLATEVDVPAGKTLTAEGRPGREFMIVLAGEAVATRNGNEVARFGPGDFFGEIALLDSGPRTATITATTPMALAVIGTHEFDTALNEVPTLARRIMQGLARRLRQVDGSTLG